MNLTRELALELHRQMWTDMQKALGDNPSKLTRCEYKENWINKHFPNDSIFNDCFLCEYCCEHQFSERYEFEYDFCECPIKWPSGRCEDGYLNDRWGGMPISKLLALPERGDEMDEEIEEEPAEMKDGLYLCDLQYSAEGDCTGYMYLTKQEYEYETAKKVVNTCNWQNVCDEGYAGSLSIYCKKLEEK